MRWVSYAQHGEDVYLRRLFPPERPGFYLDVGANHPSHFSITRAFYDAGWRGVNVEPGAIHQLLARERPHDVNLNVGLSDRVGTLTFYEFLSEDSIYSTFSESEARERQQKYGTAPVQRVAPVTTLAAVCEQYVTGPIEFLSIDVEGHELEVLRGADWQRWRPRAVVVEATRPGQFQFPTHQNWEHLLFEAGYLFAHADGLNRYYLAQEARALLPHFAAIPNTIWDEYIPYWHHREMESLRRRNEELAARLVPYEGLGPRSVALARRFQRLAAPFRKLGGLVQR